MDFVVENEKDYKIIRLKGRNIYLEYNNQSVEKFYDVLLNVAFQEPVDKSIAIDFSNVKLIDSTGISTLIKFYKTIKGKKIEVNIFGCNPYIFSVLKLLKLDTFFNISKETSNKDST